MRPDLTIQEPTGVGNVTMTINGANKLPCRTLQGYTLAEAMITVVVLSIASAGVLLPFSSGAAVRAEGVRRTLAAKLAADLMEEIVGQNFDQIVARYNGYAEPQGQIKDASGVVFTDLSYAKLSRNVTCAYVYVPQESGAVAPKFICVTVQVFYNGKEVARIRRLVGE